MVLIGVDNQHTGELIGGELIGTSGMADSVRSAKNPSPPPLVERKNMENIGVLEI